MGTVDSGELLASVGNIETDCDNNKDKMVNITPVTDYPNKQISSVHVNGISVEVATPIKNNWETNENLNIEQTSTNSTAKDLTNIQDTNISSDEARRIRKRKLSPEQNLDLQNKKIKSLSDDPLENLENTGRGKRIKKPTKKSRLYDDYTEESGDQSKGSPLKRSDRRYIGDAGDQDYRPSCKVSKVSDEVDDSDVFVGPVHTKENGIPMASLPLPPTSDCVSDSNNSLGGSFEAIEAQDHRRKSVKEEMKVTNENGEVENLTIIDITNSSEGSDGEGGDVEQNELIEKDAPNELPEVHFKNNSGCESHVLDTVIPQKHHDNSISEIGGELLDKPNVETKLVTPQVSDNKVNIAGLVVNNHASANMPTLQNAFVNPVTPTHVNLQTNSELKPTQSINHFVPKDKEPDLVVLSKPQRTFSKKPVRKSQKRHVQPDQFLNDIDQKHINRLKQIASKRFGPQRQERGPDSTKLHVGPYVQCQGPKDSLKLCKVINVKDSSDADHTSSNITKYSMLPSETCSSRATPQMSDTVPWKCIFCSHGTSYMNLGDLFGPYYSQQSSSPSETRDSNKSLSPSLTSKKCLKIEKISQPSTSNDLPPEMWVHCDCAVWTNGVFVAGGRLRGMEEAAVAAQQSICCVCQQKGATLGCLVKGCDLKYHYICALQADCMFQEENFSILCPKHKTKPYRINRLVLTAEPTVSLL